jgi:hypothetical protein
MLEMPIGGAAMRRMQLTSLVVLSLLVNGTSGYAMGRPSRRAHWLPPAPAASRPVARVQPRVPEKNPSWSCEGWGQTREDAEVSALKRARESIVAYLAANYHRMDWAPNLDYIKNHMVKESEPDSKDFGEGVGELQGMKLLIEVSPKDWQYFLGEDRRVRSEFRMAVLAKVLAGLVAFLGAFAGYLRLEELTKGYYTAWLRLAAIGFVSAVSAGIWWIS